MVVSIKVDMREVDRLARQLGDQARKQIQFATARALTQTARAGKDAVGKEIGSVFDRATPWIRNSAFSTSASKARLEAVVGIRDTGAGRTPAHYLREHIAGGERGSKPMELAMRSMGVLPVGWLAMPSKDGVRKDAYGNVSRGTIVRILAALQQRQGVKKGGDTFRLFVVKPGLRSISTDHLMPGIWSVSRFGDHSVIKPVFLFVHEASYRKVLDVPEIVSDIVRREFGHHFRAAYDEAMRTAR